VLKVNKLAVGKLKSTQLKTTYGLRLLFLTSMMISMLGWRHSSTQLKTFYNSLSNFSGMN